MRFRYLFFILILCSQISFSSGTIAVASEDDFSPKLSIDSIFYDYGEIRRGEIISHSFMIKNLGNGDLEIKDTRPD